MNGADVDDFDALIKLLTSRELSSAGILLTVFVVYVVALNREWLVTGPRYRECREAKTSCESASSAATAELHRCERDYTDARISIVRHEEREFARQQWQHSQQPIPPHPQRGS